LKTAKEAIPTMDDAATRKIRVSEGSSAPVKMCWSVGPHILLGIADELVKRFAITEGTYVQEEATDDGILLRIKHSMNKVVGDDAKKV
jgi:hypothetical protein